jgi:hypothetical protein
LIAPAQEGSVLDARSQSEIACFIRTDFALHETSAYNKAAFSGGSLQVSVLDPDISVKYKLPRSKKEAKEI